MFAGTDDPGARFVKVYLLTNNGEMPAVPPLMREAGALRTAPTADNLERVADRLCAETWVRGPQGPSIAWPERGPGQATGENPIDYSAIRVELWRYAFDAKTNQLHAFKYRDTTKTRIGT
jgi:hypothetical protein